jgi:hypothetical protein
MKRIFKTILAVSISFQKYCNWGPDHQGGLRGKNGLYLFWL